MRGAGYVLTWVFVMSLSPLAMAQSSSINSVKVAPATALVGQPVRVTVEGEVAGVCGLRVEYGNGDVDVTKMSESGDRFPRSFNKSYAQPGTYTITAKGGRDGMTFGCPGEAKTTVTINAAPKPAPAPEPPKAPAPPPPPPAPVASEPPKVAPKAAAKGSAASKAAPTGTSGAAPREATPSLGRGARVE